MRTRWVPGIAVLVTVGCSSGEGTFGGSPTTDGGKDKDATTAAGGRSAGGSGTGGTRGGTGGRATGGTSAGGTSTRDASSDAADADSSTGGRASGGVGNGAAANGGAGGGTGTGGANASGGASASGTDGGCEPDAAADVACTHDADCCGPGWTCSGFVFGNPVTVNCHAPVSGGAAIGTPCTGALSPNPACSTGVCSASFGACTKRCTGDSDCGRSGFICRGVTVNGTAMSLCARACTGDRSCPSGQICVLRDSTTEDRIEKYCRPKPTTGSPPGTTSADAATCDHGNTVVIGQDQYCTAPCDVDADCPAAVGKCQKFTFSTPVTHTDVQAGLCVKP